MKIENIKKDNLLNFENELKTLGFDFKNDKYLSEIEPNTFQSIGFKEFQKKQKSFYKETGIPVITNLMLIITDKIKIDWINHLRNINLKNDYEKQIKNKLENNNLLSKNGKYAVAALIDGDDDLSLKVLTKEQMEFAKSFVNLNFGNSDFLDVETPKSFLPKNYESKLTNEFEFIKGLDVRYVRIYKTDPLNDLILEMESVEDFSCNGESSYFLSVDQMSSWAEKNDIKFSDIYTGWEY